MLQHRPVKENDLPLICTFPQSEDELFFLFPKSTYPLTPEQMAAAITQRTDSTVVELNGEVVGFANFYRWENGGCCAIGNVVVASRARGQGVGQYLIRTMLGIAFAKYLSLIHISEPTRPY